MAVYKRGNYWYARVYWRDSKHKRHSKSRGHFHTKKEASIWEANSLADLNNGYNLKKNPVFAAYFENWYKIFKYPQLRVNTAKDYRVIINLLKKYWGKTKIKNISHSDWQKFINYFAKTHTKIVTQQLNARCKACVENAIADKIITFNFTKAINISGDQSKTRIDKVKMLTVEQIKSILQYCKKNRNKDKPYCYLIITLLVTGCRLGEALALQWHNLNAQKNTIDIHHTYVVRKHELGPTKNPQSSRTIAVPHELITMLLELKNNQSNYIFAREDKLPVDPKTVKRHLDKILKSLNIPTAYFTIHDLRHSHVALLHHDKIDWQAISLRLGHKNLATTLKTYAYLVEEDKQKYDQKIVANLEKLM